MNAKMNKQEPTGEVNDKGKGNVRKVSTAGVSWLDFARPYMKREKKGGMKKAGEDWRKLKAKREKKSKRISPQKLISAPGRMTKHKKEEILFFTTLAPYGVLQKYVSP